MDKKKFLKTKIIATIGPSSNDEKTLLKMIKNGMSVARLNFSHGKYEDHRDVIKKIRKLSENEDIPVAILQDLCGPKIRLSDIPEPKSIKKNDIIKISVYKEEKADLYTDFKELVKIVKKENTILIDDGYIELKVIDIDKKSVTCKVVVPGIVKSRKGINLPDISFSIPVFTEKDKADLEFGLEHDVDMVAMSFVDSPSNIIPIKKIMSKFSKDIPVIAKIERKKALENINKIIDKFDGIMIARGDLGVEVPPEKVPLIQKELINLANSKNKLVITATQMLESMIANPRPTRAEASDVSNAIIDGTDCVMLSAETAIGEYPVKSVNMMRRIALFTEKSDLYKSLPQINREKIDHTEAIAKSACKIASELDAKFILVFSYSGKTALILSKYRPQCPIFAFTPQKDVVLKMASYWGVFPIYIEFTPHTDEMILKGEELLKIKKFAKKGDLIVTSAGVTPMKGATNMLRISKIS